MNLYGINVNLSLTGGLFAALGPIIGRLGLMNTRVNAVTRSMTGMQKAGLGMAAVGVAVAAAGVGMARGALAISNAANDLNAAKTKLLTAGIDPRTAQRYIQQARMLGPQALGVGSHERVSMMNDLHSVFGNPAEAIAASRSYMRAFAAYRFQNYNTDREGRGFQNAAKAVDLGGRAVGLNGGLDTRKFESELRMMNAISTYTNGRVTLNDQYLFARGAGIANKGLTQEGYRNLAPIMESLGAEKTGTALMTTFQNLIGGSMKRGAVNQLVGAGLVDPNMVRNVGAGSFVLERGALAQTELFQTDPAVWVRDVLMPAAMRQQGVGAGADAQTQKDAMMAFISPLKLDRRAKAFLSETAFSHIDGTWGRDVRNIRNAEAVDPYTTHLKNNPVANQMALGTAWDDFKAALGEGAGTALIPLFQNLTTVLKGLTAWAEANPEAIGNIVKIIFALGVGLTAFGVVLGVIGVGILAVTFPIIGTALAIAAAVGVVVAAAAWLMTLDWKAIWQAVKNGVGQAIKFVAVWIGKYIGWWIEKGRQITGAIDTVKSVLWNGIKSLFTGLADFIRSKMPKFNGGEVVDGVAQGPRGEPGEGAARAGMSLVRPSSYVGPPPRQGDGQVIRTTVNLDGRQIADVVDRRLASNNRHNTGPTSYDGDLSWGGGPAFA